MWDNMIGRLVRRSARNLVLWNAVILIAIIAFFVISSRYWYNFVLGPFPLSSDELVKLKDDSGIQFYVTVRGDACDDSGAREITVNKRNVQRESAKYLRLYVGDNFLVVKADLSDSPNEVERRGVLKNLADEMNKPKAGGGPAPGPRPRGRNAANQNAVIGPQLKPLPVVLDSTITRTKGFIGLAILIPTGLINIVNIFRGMGRLANPQSHPLAKKLLKYGEPEEVAQKIEDEYQSGDTEKIGPVTFTRSWLVRPTTFRVDVMFLGDAAWAYKTITQHYTNGIPTGKTYTANLCDIHGAQFTVALKSEALTDDFVMAVVQRVPWVLFGFDAALDELWKKDKAQLYEIVEARRKEFAEQVRREREEPDEVQPVGDDEPIDVEPA